MRLDRFSNPIFNEADIFRALYQGKQLSNELIVDYTDDIRSLETISELKFQEPLDADISVEDFDMAMQSDWHMPDGYKYMDIEEWIWSKTPMTGPENKRVGDELAAFKERNMLDLLRWLKYFVDTCEKEGIVWGVGRGSSVASYILFLIVFPIIKY